LSWGMVHPDIIALREMFDDAGFDVPKINMKAYMEARSLTQEFIDDFLGYFIEPKNRFMSSLLVGCGLPGGMMGSMMADLKGVHDGINRHLRETGKPELTQDDMLVKLFEEVEYVWPKLGYPPLVTPFSQYVKNVALLNVLQLVKGHERYSMIDNNTWDMILGKAGLLPGPLAPEIIELAAKQDKQFFTGTPQENYPDELDKYRKEMAENNWDAGQDEEELFELAMHDRQYRDYKSGVAKKRFGEELLKAKQASINKDAGEMQAVVKSHTNLKDIKAAQKGRVYYNFGFYEVPIKVGDVVKIGQRLGYTEWMLVYYEILSDVEGVVAEVCFQNGNYVKQGEVVLRIE
jgi:pyruvate carboxylase subunit B